MRKPASTRTRKKKELAPIADHPLMKWAGTSKDDPYWDKFMAAIKRERAKSDRIARKAIK